MLDLLETLNDGAPFPMQFYGDNQAAIEIISSGKNNTMRHFSRQHGIDLAFLHDHFDVLKLALYISGSLHLPRILSGTDIG